MDDKPTKVLKAMSNERRQKVLLSLDAGSIQGVAQLEILYEILSRVGLKMSDDSGNGNLAPDGLGRDAIFPCDFFDLMVGTGTGGINAILMGRLGLSIKECMEAWEGLDNVFKLEFNPDPGAPLFRAERLEAWAKQLVERHTGDPDTMMLFIDEPKKPNNNYKSCRVAVTSMRADYTTLPAIFQSYRTAGQVPVYCTIWEVLRATTAAPLLFESVFIGNNGAKQEFISDELGPNPISYLFQEKRNVWLRSRPPTEIGCVISIGTGKEHLRGQFSRESVSGPAGGLYGMSRVMLDCERKHQEVEASYRDQEERIYFRFNAEKGASDLSQSGEESRASIQSHVVAYMEDMDQVLCVERLIHRMLSVLLELDRGQEDALPSRDLLKSNVERTKALARSLEATSEEDTFASTPTPTPGPRRSHLVTPKEDAKKVVVNEATSSEIIFPSALDTRVDVGDPDPGKEILRFLRIPYLLSERVLQLARDNRLFHVLGVTIARQALRLVLVLNATVAEDGPNQEQLDERVALRDQLVDLEAAIREWGSKSGDKHEGDEGILKEQQQYRLLSVDSGGIPESGPRQLNRLGAATRDLNLDSGPQFEYDQYVEKIKKQYDLFFAPRFYFVYHKESSPSKDLEERFSRLLDYDKKTVAFDAWQQSRGLGRIGHLGDAFQSHFRGFKEIADAKSTTPTHQKAGELTPEAPPDQPDPLSDPGKVEATLSKPGPERSNEAPATILEPPPYSAPAIVDTPFLEEEDTSGRPLKLLALDGGGIRGISELKILQALMYRIQWEKKLVEPPKPCECFDMIGGTSAGGIIAILLGRLRLSVDRCLEIYPAASKEVFGSENWGWGLFQSRFNHINLEKLIVDHLEQLLPRSPTLPTDAMTDIGDAWWPGQIAMYDKHPKACKTFVTATSGRDARKGMPYLFRTYKGPGGVTNKNCMIWQAIRATSATPTLFDPIQIEDELFVDGGFGCNNPVKLLYDEAREFWPWREIGCIISLGTGMPRTLSLENPTIFDTRFPKNWVQTLERTATECETAHQDMLRKRELRGKYFRFNVWQGLQGVSLIDWQKLGEVASVTEGYMREVEVDRKMDEAIAKLLALDEPLGLEKAWSSETHVD